MNIEQFLTDKVAAAVSTLYGNAGAPLQIQKTRKEFEGDYTLVVFPLLKASRKSPEATATEIGEYLVANTPEIKAFNVIKGFLNLSLDSAFWAARFREVAANDTFGQAAPTGRTVMIEYSSPNTNKPLHLGHIRNNLLGYSVAQILKANGNKVIKVNLVNDRGIHTGVNGFHGRRLHRIKPVPFLTAPSVGRDRHATHQNSGAERRRQLLHPLVHSLSSLSAAFGTFCPKAPPLLMV